MRYKHNKIGQLGEGLLSLVPGVKRVNKRSYDFIIGSDRVELKTAYPHNLGGWHFNLPKSRPWQKRWADYYVLLALAPTLEPARIYKIPKEELLGKSSVWIGAGGKWEGWRVSAKKNQL